MINTPVQLELSAEPTALPGSSQQTSADGANTMTREVSRPATIADKQSLMEASSDSIQPTEDDFFEIVGLTFQRNRQIVWEPRPPVRFAISSTNKAAARD
jgi:hypothetical protein